MLHSVVLRYFRTKRLQDVYRSDGIPTSRGGSCNIEYNQSKRSERERDILHKSRARANPRQAIVLEFSIIGSLQVAKVLGHQVVRCIGVIRAKSVKTVVYHVHVLDRPYIPLLNASQSTKFVSMIS